MTYLLLCVQCWNPDYGQRNCPKHVEFYSKNKFEKLVHLVGFIVRMDWTMFPQDRAQLSILEKIQKDQISLKAGKWTR